MAFEAYDDYEQSERVQKWLRQNGLSIIVGVAIGLVGIFGWQQWKSHRQGHEGQAAEIYQQAQTAALTGKPDLAETLTDTLLKDYSDTAYASFAASERAQRQVTAKQLDKALVSLAEAEKYAPDAELKALMQYRTAQVQLAMGKADDALATLGKMPPKSYESISQELRGDAQVKLGHPEEALKAYEAAKAAMGDNAPQGGALLQNKIDDLAVAGKQGA
ncbi:YfgM family protein [Dyella sp.]|uniref:YfgM family protein n=1 Tax=Dyella sp. TaxID=1869338 RepID=UPI002ED0F899